MTTAVTRPDDLLAHLLSNDPARPRLTWYAPAERIELSGRVLSNWVSKAANLLAEDLDVGVGGRVALDLPAHWRACYWGLAAWTLGAALVVDDADGSDDTVQVRIAAGDDTREAVGPAGDLVAVTLAALARGSDVPLPPGAIDEAAVLPTYGDVVAPWERAQATDPALVTAARTWSFADVVPATPEPGARILLVGDDLVTTLRAAAGAWASGGSVVLLDAAYAAAGGPDLLDRLRAQEGATT